MTCSGVCLRRFIWSSFLAHDLRARETLTRGGPILGGQAKGFAQLESAVRGTVDASLLLINEIDRGRVIGSLR